MRGLLCLAVTVVCPLIAADQQLKPGESEIYNDVIKDLTVSNLRKAVADLDSWSAKYPESDFRDDRTALYVQTYVLANEFPKALDAAQALISKDLNQAFSGAQRQATTIRLLYNVVAAISQTPEPTRNQIVTATKAAHLLMDYDQPIPGVDPAKWAEARNDMRAKAAGALLYMEIVPGIQAMAKNPPDCAGAEDIYRRALSHYPDRAALSYELGRALNCEAKTNPAKQMAAIYEFVRAATIDPTLGDSRNDGKKIRAFADNAYIRFHGSDEGLEQLRQQVREFPLPPADLAIKTAEEITTEREGLFAKNHPQLALWKKIKALLTADDGPQYFDAEIKDAALPQLTAVLIEARPACRPKELLLGVPLPDAQKPLMAEITLKLDRALNGKPEMNQEIQFEGIAREFAKSPFMLTIETEGTKVEGLRSEPCGPPRKR